MKSYKGKKVGKPEYSTTFKDGKHECTITINIDGQRIKVRSQSAGPNASATTAYNDAMKKFQRECRRAHPDTFNSSGEVLDLGAPTQVSQNKMDSMPVDINLGTDEDEENEDSQTRDSVRGSSRPNPASEEDASKSWMIKGIPRNHLDFINNNDGRGTKLEEPVPSLVLRAGEAALTANSIDKAEGVDNNAAIILGRDFSPDFEYKFSGNREDARTDTRYSDHMGAGAIDIIVGRMAPFPLKKVPSSNSEIPYARAFNTYGPSGSPIAGEQLKNGTHPGMAMDAARIYISQMTTVDHNFKINSSATTEEGMLNTKTILRPTSAIMLKADKCRMHSRQDIKLVTGGPYERYNSHGNQVSQNNGIHLIAENGRDKNGKVLPQQPFVLGDNLVAALTKMIQLMSDLSGIVDNLAASQMLFNSAVGAHFHLQAPVIPTMIDFALYLQNVLTGLDQIVNGRLQLFKNDLNGGLFIANYLSPLGNRYINSLHNTVN